MSNDKPFAAAQAGPSEITSPSQEGREAGPAPAAPESETPETDAAVVIGDGVIGPRTQTGFQIKFELNKEWVFADLARSLERRLALAQTEIKGHMRTEDDLKRDIGIYQASIEKFAMQHQRKVMGLETRVAELERALARLGSMEAFNGPRFVTERDTELIARIDFARAALKSRA